MTDLPILNALIFAVTGLVVLSLACSIAVKVAPFDVWKSLVQDRNVAVGIFAGAVVLGMAWIIAATMH